MNNPGALTPSGLILFIRSSSTVGKTSPCSVSRSDSFVRPALCLSKGHSNLKLTSNPCYSFAFLPSVVRHVHTNCLVNLVVHYSRESFLYREKTQLFFLYLFNNKYLLTAADSE